VLAAEVDLSWLYSVDERVQEVHRQSGDSESTLNMPTSCGD
jgi:hypothetical protein